ncbi:rod shape-determining protein MreD [Loigolactobacillus zhaoyuanensis]|uniref:rod shape-determining protein MreD n=1 Tax=Loigolactobacillus zhaoyuanensis TaxID=2486017 RepID=UPI000F73A01C|nr:rod shape-determining protein MreD [Loigolactobacillus zhaoyuanensis]
MRLREKIWVNVLLVVLMLLDGSFSYLFGSTLHSFPDTMIIRLVVLGLVLVYFFAPNFPNLMIVALILGLVYDSFYTGILGVYMFLFPLIIFLTRWIAQFFAPAPLVVGAIYLIDLTVLESLVYGMNIFMGLTTMALGDFIPNILGPTLALNLVLFIFLYFPLRQLIVKLDSLY